MVLIISIGEMQVIDMAANIKKTITIVVPYQNKTDFMQPVQCANRTTQLQCTQKCMLEFTVLHDDRLRRKELSVGVQCCATSEHTWTVR